MFDAAMFEKVNGKRPTVTLHKAKIESPLRKGGEGVVKIGKRVSRRLLLPPAKAYGMKSSRISKGKG
jgi:hypothetical protein